MWIDSFLSSIVNKYASTYFHNLNGANVMYSLKKGYLDLQNLKLKANILNNIDLPLSLVDGTLDSLSLKYIGENWYSFEAYIKGLHLVIELQNEDSDDNMKDRYHSSKLSKLQLSLEKHEVIENLKLDPTLMSLESTSKSLSYAEKVVANLSIIVEDINITFIARDRNGSPLQIFVHLDGFSVITTDDKWSRTLVQQHSDLIYKLINISGLRLSISKFKTVDESEDAGNMESVQVIQPVDLTVNLTLNMNPLLIKEVPRYNAKISFSELHLSFDVDHYHSILDLVEKIKSFNEHGLNAFFIKPIRFLNSKEKWIYFKDKILNKPIPKMYLLVKKVLKIRQLVEEYTKLLYIVKIDQKSKPSDLDAARMKDMEVLIPSGTLSEINIRILEENKKILEREKNVTFLGSIYNKFFGWSQPSLDESTESTKQNTIISDVIALPEDFSANQISYQVSFTVTAFKISMFERDMAKQILNFELNELNVNLLYKPSDMNSIKFQCSIFDICITGYPEGTSVYHIINTNDICRKDPNSKFIIMEYVGRGIECSERKTCVSLSVESTNIHILLKFFLHLKELFYRPSLISVQKLKNYASEKMTEFSDIIVSFVRSSSQNIELNLEFKRTSLVFLTDVDLFIIARFNRLSFKTFFIDKETNSESSRFLPDSEYKYYTVYLDIDHFNIFYADKLTFRMMKKSIQLDKMMINYSILYPVKISIHSFANREDSGKTSFSYTSHAIIDEIKLQLSFESIQIIQTIVNDTLNLLSSQKEDIYFQESPTISLDIPSCIEQPKKQENPFDNRKLLNIVLSVTKFSINIKWNNVFNTDSVSSDKFMSNVYLLVSGISGEYAFLTLENIFSLKCKSMIISHQVNTWIHTIFLSNKSISLEYNIISQKNSLILKKSDPSLNLSHLGNDSTKNCLKLSLNDVYNNFHYNSMQHFVKFAEILFLLFTKNPVPASHGALVIPPPPSTINSFKIIFNVEQSILNILYHHKTLFSAETNIIKADLLINSDCVGISFSFEHFSVNYLESRNNQYPAIIKIPNESLFKLKILFATFDPSSGRTTLTFQFEADFSNLQITFLYRSLISFQNWISCLTSNNTALNQAIKVAYDTASTMGDKSQKFTKIIADLTIKDAQILIPVKSFLSGGICINCNQLLLKTNVEYSNNFIKFSLLFIINDNSIHRFNIRDGNFSRELLIFVKHIQAKATYSSEGNSDSHPPVSMSLDISQIQGTVLPEDIVMLKFFMIENVKELPKLHEDKYIYTFFDLYPSNSTFLASDESDDSTTVDMILNIVSIQIHLLYSDEQIDCKYFDRVNSHENLATLIEILADKTTIEVKKKTKSVTANIIFDLIKIYNCLKMNETKRNFPELRIDRSKYCFFHSKSLDIKCVYQDMIDAQLKIMKPVYYFDFNMLNYIQSQILPILSDYEIDDQKLNQMPNQIKNFYNIIYSNDFSKKTASIGNRMIANIEFEDSRIVLDSGNDESITRILATKSSFRLIYELKNGIQQFKFFCAEFFVYFIPAGISIDFEPVSYLMKIDNIFIHCSLNSNIFSNFSIMLDFLICNFSRQSLMILLHVKDEFLKQPTTTPRISNISHSISESCDNISQNVLFQPHRMSISSKRLGQDYNSYNVHVDQDVLARYTDGFYYESTVVMKFSSHYVVRCPKLAIEFEISTLDPMAIIPMTILTNFNVSPGDVVLYKDSLDTRSTSNYSLGSLVDISSFNNKLSIKIRSFQSYEIVPNILLNNVYKIPDKIISAYRGIGLYLFCRNSDGNYYPGIVLSRKRFMVQYGFFNQNKISSTIFHKIVDDSSFALMWDKVNQNETVKKGETILVVENEFSCVGRVARVQSSDETGINVIYFNNLNVAKVSHTSCIHLRPQSYGIKGLGSRYFGVFRETVVPVICTKINADHDVYEIYSNKSPISVKESDNLFIDTLASPEILYCFQSAIVTRSTDDNTFFIGNIVTKIDENTFVVLSSEGICLNSCRDDILIKEPTQDKVASLPISMIEQEGSINASSINIFIEAEIGDKKMPLFFFDCPLSIKIYSWSKYETQLKCLMNISSYYLNQKQLVWEPFLEFCTHEKNSENRNLKISYSDNSDMDCSFFPQYQNIVGVAPKNFRIVMLDNLLFTVSEQFFGAFKVLRDDIGSSKQNISIPKPYESIFCFDNKTSYDLQAILYTGCKNEKFDVELLANKFITITSIKSNFYEVVSYDISSSPTMFLKISDTCKKIFKLLNTAQTSYYHYIDDKTKMSYSFVIKTYIDEGIYNIIFRYPFTIKNLLDFQIYFYYKLSENQKIRVLSVPSKQSCFLLNDFSNKLYLSISKNEGTLHQFTVIDFEHRMFPYKFKRNISGDNQPVDCCLNLSFDNDHVSWNKKLKKYENPMVLFISPALTVKNNLNYDIKIFFKNNNSIEVYKISKKSQFDIMRLSPEGGKIFMTINIISMSDNNWVSDVSFNFKSDEENKNFEFHNENPIKSEKILLTVSKSFDWNFFVTVSSTYTIINHTKHFISIKFIQSKGVESNFILEFPSLSYVPMSTKFHCEKACVSINSSMWSEAFPLNVVGSYTNLMIKTNSREDFFYYILLSINRNDNESIELEFKNSVVFKNELNNFIHIMPDPKNCLNSIFLDTKNEVSPCLALPKPPCEFSIYVNDPKLKNPIQYKLALDRSVILFSEIHKFYFVGYCYFKNNIFNFIFTHVEPRSFENILLNYSKNTVYCHTREKTECLFPNYQVYFGSCFSNNTSKINVFSFYPELNRALPEIQFESLTDKITRFKVDNNIIYIAKFYDVLHTTFVVTENYNFALHCSDTESESTLLSLDLKFCGFDISILSSILAREIMLISLFKLHDNWYLYEKHVKIVKLNRALSLKLDSAHISYIQSNKTQSEYKLDSHKSVDFKKMIMSDSQKGNYMIKFASAYALDINLNISISYEIQNLTLNVNRLQIDSPSYDSINPVILSQTVNPPSVVNIDTSEINFLVASIFVNRPINYKSLGPKSYQNLEYFKFLMQEFDISLDVPFILTLANYADYVSYLVASSIDVSSTQKSLQDSDHEESKYLVKYFHLPPIKFNVTFSTSSMNIKTKEIDIPGSKNNLSYYNLIKLLILHNPLIDVSRTPLLLPCLNIEQFDSLMTLNDLFESSKDHYISSFKSNLFQLLFGLNAIGNPWGSVSQFAHGMKSFFYEPYQGVVMSNSFKKGVLFGVKGLYSGTIGTAATALTSITETLGKGLASLTFDSNFEENRNQIMKMRKSHPVQGLKEGSIGLFKGITGGVTGLFTSPVEAYKEKKDAAHVFKGVGKGFAGLFVKPLSGIVDFASSSLNVLSKAAEVGQVQPRRGERCFYMDGVVRRFSFIEMQKYHFFILITKSDKSFSDDKFANGVFYKHQLSLITSQHIVILKINEANSFDIIRTIQIPSIHDIEQNCNTLKIYFKSNILKPCVLSFETQSIAERFHKHLQGLVYL